MELQTNEPTAIRAGDSVSWSRELPEYSSDAGWALKYRLLYTVGTAVAIASTGAGTTHTVELTSAQTATFAAGTATLVAFVENATTADRVTLEATPVTILPDLTTAATHDGRSANQVALANAEAALAAYMAKGQAHVAEYDIAGRRMKFRAASEITDLISYYERECAKERVAQALLEGNPAPGRVAVRF
ncbi:MAG: hypothetical protein ROZ09_15170 [Thiobacillus sp.]|jgi:hypothetical protein|uniref:hypothetical protein n=1 Tax=Thiobacillus sp. TaxID=924 RepID=UPI002894D776|nr:hypothetical protein [Thiobacillus sp.]MDT3708161.1 hypothetical protein [Thiobacillus sp.]